MAQFLVLIYEDEQKWVDFADGAQEAMEQHREFGEKHAAALRGGAALQPTTTATTIRRADGTDAVTGVPASPAAWLTTAARHRALDHVRRASTLTRLLPMLVTDDVIEPVEPADGEQLPDDRLRLICTCCHPALAPEARVALTLRLVCGLTTAEVAHSFLVSEATMAARITRAKKKIAGAGIPYRVPSAAELPARMDAILS